MTQHLGDKVHKLLMQCRDISHFMLRNLHFSMKR